MSTISDIQPKSTEKRHLETLRRVEAGSAFRYGAWLSGTRASVQVALTLGFLGIEARRTGFLRRQLQPEKYIGGAILISVGTIALAALVGGLFSLLSARGYNRLARSTGGLRVEILDAGTN